MPNLDQYVRQPDLGAEVHLFEIDFTIFEGGDILRLTTTGYENQVDENGAQYVTFGGTKFLSYPIKLEGVSWDGKNAPSQPQLAVANLNNIARGLIETYDDLIGAKISRFRTYERYLDPLVPGAVPGNEMVGAEPDTEQRFGDETFYFFQVKSVGDDAIVWTLSTLSDVRGAMIPKRSVIKRTCVRPYRRFVDGDFVYPPQTWTCPYAGSAYFDPAGTPTDAAHDACGRLVPDCKLRFPDVPLPGYFFPGVSPS